MESVEVSLRIWKKHADQDTTDLFTISYGKTAICHDMPLEQAMGYLSNYLEELQ